MKKPMTRLRKQKRIRNAAHLIKHKFAVLPIKLPAGGKQRSGKTPACPNGVYDATNDIKKFRELVQCLDDFNIGVAAGKPSGANVIDLDPRDGSDKSIKALERRLGELPETVTADTGGGGEHRYFKVPKRQLRSAVIANGVEFLSDGKYAVAPDSMHGSGNRYQWQEGHSPDDIEMAMLPRAWRDKIAELGKKKASEPAAEAPGDVIPEGERNNELTRIAGFLRRSSMNEAEMTDALAAVNRSRCNPPLDPAEVSEIARSVSKYPSGDPVQSSDPGEQLAYAVLREHFNAGAHLRHERDGRFWRWTGVFWDVIDDKVLQRLMLKTAKNLTTQARRRPLVQESFALLSILQSCEDDLLHFHDDPPPVINVRNGELWLLDDGEIELRPHDPATGMRHVLPVEYDPDATCPEYDQALKEIFRDAQKPASLIRILHELFGYVIQPARDRAMIIIFMGKGNNGKTSLIHLLRHLIGLGLVHSGRVEDLEKTQFAIGNLFGKMLFVDDDVKAGAKLPDGTLKKISEAKILTGERKFKDAFEFKVRTLPILLCNNAPSLADLSPGMRRRLHVIPFARELKDDEVDRKLFKRIAENELAGVLNRALAGWRRLQERERFTRSIDMREALNELLANANPLQGYIDECCDIEAAARTRLEIFYLGFQAWTKENGFTMTQTKPTVRRNLEHMGYLVPRHGRGRTIMGLAINL